VAEKLQGGLPINFQPQVNNINLWLKNCKSSLITGGKILDISHLLCYNG
jgi:hypothetical protein